MRLFYAEDIKDGQKRYIITGSEARHIYKVLRMRSGDELLLMDQNGNRYRCVIEDIRHGKVYVLIKEKLLPPPSSPVHITVCISLIRSDPMDLVIQKASELGAEVVQPFYSERSIVRIAEDKIEHRLRHWKEVAKNAAKQCGRPKPIQVLPPILLKELLAQDWEKDLLRLFLWEQERETSIKDVLRSTEKVDKIVGVIGPEGGFTLEEARLLKEKGFISVSMGGRILRAETAAIAFVALCQYEFGDLGLSYDMKASSPVRP